MKKAFFLRLFLLVLLYGVNLKEARGFEFSGSLLGPCVYDFSNCTYDIYQYDMWETLKSEPCLSSLVYDFNRVRMAEIIYLLHKIQIDQPPLSAFCNKQKTRPLSLKKIERMMDKYTHIDETVAWGHEITKGCTGAIISYDERVDAVVVRGLLAGSPAYKSGIRQNDIILRVDGVVVGDDVSRATSHLRGAPKSVARVQVKRGNAVLKRRVVRTECDNEQMEWARCHDIGYMHVLEFGDNIIGENLKNALLFFYAHDVAGVVIDVRGNLGGSVNVARALAGVFLPDESVVYFERSPYPNNETRIMETSINEGVAYWLADKPLIVLVDHMTASSSEIFAGALSSQHRAVLVGGQTYGKGVGQRPVYLSDDSKMWITSFLWYLPTGENINHIGIQPHVDKQDAEKQASNKVLTGCLFPEDRTLRYAIETILYQTNNNGH